MEYSFVKINFKKIMIYTTETSTSWIYTFIRWFNDTKRKNQQSGWTCYLVCQTSDDSINELSKTVDKTNFKDNDDDKPNLKDMNSTDDNEEGNDIDFNGEIYSFIPWSKISLLY